MRHLAAAVAAAIVCCTVIAAARADTTLPNGFEDRSISPVLSQVVAFEAAPDGRVFVAEKPGLLKVVRPDGAVVQVLDIRSRVNSLVDRGLLGMALDAQFASNGFVYLLYVHEDNPLRTDAPKVSRLTRIQVRPDNTVANPVTPETVLLGSAAVAPCPAPSNTSDCIPADGVSHVIGSVRAAPDGTLYVGTGDANHGAKNAPDPFRPYDERSFAGKIMHIDRNGRGLPGHPFCPANGDLTQVCTKIFAAGFRNPFRFTVRPDGRSLVVGDVGDITQEEVDLVRAGRNYGWPCYEGSVRAPRYRDTPRCGQEYAKEATGGGPAPPLWTYPRSDGAAVIGGPTYPPSGPFPTEFHDTILVGDYVQGFLKRLRIDANERLVAVEDFASDWRGVDLGLLPDGRLGYADFSQVRAISFAGGNRAPVARASASPIGGRVPLEVRFTGSASSDADGDALTYSWDFGDGGGSSEADPSHVYTEPGSFHVTLTVTDPAGVSDTAALTILSGNEPPTASMDAPADGALYRDGAPVALRGSGVDPETGALDGAALRWRIVLHHGTHTHEFDDPTGAEASFTPLTSHDADSFYEVTLTATDPAGLTDSTTVTVRPETTRFGIDSNPQGAPVTYDGGARVTPFATDSAIGFNAVVSAGERFTRGGTTYIFSRWSDSNAPRQRTITIPAFPSGVYAIYRLATPLDLLFPPG